jgi:hypothetical protein
VTQVTIKKKIPKNSKNPKKIFSFHEFFQNLLKNKKISKNFQKFPKISKNFQKTLARNFHVPRDMEIPPCIFM